MAEIDAAWEVTVEDVKRMMDQRIPFLLIDVREPEEHKTCRVDGAALMPLGELPQRVDEIMRRADGRPIVTHCHHGGRSLKAAVFLRGAGIENVRSMAGGIDEWSVRIDPRVPRY
ncbi:MAG: hypothetical protein HUU22_16780 [Phycisphaerae bacterium]|nr:hypothetical protein [Phycisphaerae bacterium]NUQ47676.1 hypothetical protein [Phycisphaerae bacterium]